VADQVGVKYEHIVQDSCSTDGTGEWLQSQAQVTSVVEKDTGMYDAVNRGFRGAKGEILAYLNCDEQYLGGALSKIRRYFQDHPKVEVVLAGTIVVDASGKYLCHRPSLVPNGFHIWWRFPILTSSVFLRRSVFFERRIEFDPKWRDLGDLHWVLELKKRGVPMAVYDQFTSTFTDTGDNMNLKIRARREYELTQEMVPGWVRQFRWLWILHHRLRRLFAGHFSLPQTSYSIYTLQDPNNRVRFDINRPTGIWKNRL